MQGWCSLAAATLAAGLLAACTAIDAPSPALPGALAPWSGPAWRGAVVAVSQPEAAKAGAAVLRQGGNAVDAAVAIAYALNVVEPQSAGIGGGGFMMVHLAASGETFVVDSRERAPAAASADQFVGVAEPTLQGLAVGVPGMVRGTALALQRWGRLPLAQVLEPAIALADQGFAAGPHYAAISCNPRSRNSPEAAAFFCPHDGGPPVAGERVRNAPLADTLRLLAAHGPDCFYRLLPELGCDIARGIVEGQAFGHGGRMRYADLEAYRPAVRQPIEGRYRGWRIRTMGPPSSGALTLLQVLQMLERFPLGDAAQGYGAGSVQTAQVMADALRIAFADRSVWMGDADFVPVPQRGLLDAAYVGQRGAALVPGRRLMPDPVPGDPRPFDGAGPVAPAAPRALAPPLTGPGETTTHFSVIDREGNVVSYTNTIESLHGIGVFAGYRRADGSLRSHGFLLNNELTDFNLAPSQNPYTGAPGFNDVQPGKRPRSSMTPVIVFAPDGRPVMAYGSPGGATIISTVLQVTVNLVDHRMPLQQAIAAPRFAVVGAGPVIVAERALPAATRDGLKALGYTLVDADIGSVQAVLQDPATGLRYGAADARREGSVIGEP